MKQKHRNAESLTEQAPTEIRLEQLPTVQLSKREYAIAKHIGTARAISHEPANQTTYGDQDAADAQITGVITEWAIGKVIRQPIDDGIYVLGDGGRDFVLEDGRTADAKGTATDMEIPDLIVSAEEPLRADVYVLAHRIDERTVRIIGWAEAETVADRKPKRFPGSDLNYIVPPEQLNTLPIR